MAYYRVILRVTSGTEMFCLLNENGMPSIDEDESTIFDSLEYARNFRNECEVYFSESLKMFTMECCYIEQYCDTLGWGKHMTLLQQEHHIDTLVTI